MNSLPASIASIHTGAAYVNLWDFRGSGVDPTGNNDSTAGVQAAVNQAAATNQCAVLWVPPGTYALGGAVHAGNGANAQVLLPQTNDVGAYCPSLTIRGMSPLPRFIGGTPAANTYSCFKSSATTGAMFGSGYATGSTLGLPPQGGYFSATGIGFEDLFFVTGQNPQVSAMNLGYALFARVRDVQVLDTFSVVGSRVLPTHTSQFGLCMPYQQNYGAGWNLVENYFAGGQYAGLQLSEHSRLAFGDCNHCHDGLVLMSAQHLITIDHYVSGSNFNALTVASTDPYETYNHTRFVARISVEQAGTGAFSGGHTLYDPNNYGSGLLYYSMNYAFYPGGNDGVGAPFNQSGGANVIVQSLNPAGGNP